MRVRAWRVRVCYACVRICTPVCVMYVYVRVRVCKVCSCVRVSEAVKLHNLSVRLNDERVAFKAARHSRGSEQLVLRVSDTGGSYSV